MKIPVQKKKREKKRKEKKGEERRKKGHKYFSTPLIAYTLPNIPSTNKERSHDTWSIKNTQIRNHLLFHTHAHLIKVYDLCLHRV